MQAAIEYTRRGLRVVDLKPGEKHPTRKGWPQAATTDPETIAVWWRAKGARGVAIVTGGPVLNSV